MGLRVTRMAAAVRRAHAHPASSCSGRDSFVDVGETASWIRRYVIRNSWVKDFTPHRLRHTFATRHIAKWNREAAPVAHRLLLLSRYLGHRSFGDTWWYISADPATLRQAASRFEQFHSKR